jgi:hypothetical protein
MRSVSMLIAVSTLTFAVITGQAQAKIIKYEINGQAYSYNPKSRAEIEEARVRIEAANRADELRERARAEREANLFVRLFGSPTQAASAQADTELQKILATPSAELRQRAVAARDPDATASVRKTATVSRAKKAQVVRSNRGKRGVVARVIHTPTQVTVQPARPRSAVRSVTIDTSTGTQTTVMRDGSVRHEPASPTYSYHEDRGLSSFVDQVRGRADPIQSRLRW